MAQALASTSVSSGRIIPSNFLTSSGIVFVMLYTYIMPSVQDAAIYEPLGWKVTCFTGLGCSRRKSTFVMSLVSTILTSVSLDVCQHPGFA